MISPCFIVIYAIVLKKKARLIIELSQKEDLIMRCKCRQLLRINRQPANISNGSNRKAVFFHFAGKNFSKADECDVGFVNNKITA